MPLRRSALRTSGLLFLAATLLVTSRTNAPAQKLDAAGTGGANRAAARVLTLADYGPWNRITSPSISADGRWVTYTHEPNDGDATLFVKEIDGTTTYTVAAGAGAGGRGGRGGGGGGAGTPTFSDDSRWAAYIVNPPSATGAPGGRAGSGGGARGGGTPPAAPAASSARRLELLDLATGAKSSFPNVASFRFSNGARWLAVRLNRTTSDTSVSSGDLLLRELARGTTRNVGNVNQYAFDESGNVLAYTVDAAERLGNGVYAVDLNSGATRTLDQAAAEYDQLTWHPTRPLLAVLRGTTPAGRRERENVLLAWTEAGSADASAVAYDPGADDAFPRGVVVSEYAPLRWSRDGSRLVLGVRAQESEAPRAEAPAADVDVWHWRDPEPQSVQIVRLAQERRATLASVFHVASRRMLVLADSAMRTVTPTASGRWGIGVLDAPYRIENSWGWNLGDYYRVNLESGERTLIQRRLTRTLGTSPDGRWFLYLKDRRVHAYDLDTGRDAVIDGTAGRSFVDEDNDQAAEKPTYGVAGWSKDGRSVLLNHRHDIWQLPLQGGAAVNLTGGEGERQQIRFRITRLDAPRPGEDEGIDLSQPLTFSAYGEFTKRTGYWRGAAGQAPRPLLWDDRQFGTPIKAANADRVLFTQQTFREFPDYWVSTTAFAAPKKVTDANPQLAEYAWGSKVLVDYRNARGKRLQATLTLPAGYEPGRKYPMVVYFYEIMSNTHHQFSMPVYDDRPHMSAYASDGYLVLQPDVVYEMGKPGSSALDCVTAAVKRVIELGYADPRRIGLQGHSWGGYQSSFIVTQTDLFAAVVTGAPLTNLVSMYNVLYKSSGTVNGGILEMSQGRMGANVTPYNAPALYEDQSPIYHATKIRTPLLILHGTADGAVDWNQGLEFYNAARRNGKNVILLSYPGEPHHLERRENQKDFQTRMKQYFDHYLKGAPAPKWMADGVPQVRKGQPIQ